MKPVATPLHVVAALLALFLGAACCAARLPPPPVLGGGGQVRVVAGEEEEEKVRLGSSPPNCYSKCYGCSPCVSVQVPTLNAPSGPVAAAAAARGAGARGDTTRVATFTNYKPLGWKCQCRDRLFDP